MRREEKVKPQPPLFETQHDIVIADEFIDPVYGHLQHDGYPVIFTRERERVIAEKGLTLEELESDYGIRAYVTHLKVSYFNPVMKGDPVTLVTSATQPRRFQLEFHHTMTTGDEINAKADCLYVVMDTNNRPIRIPPELLEILK